jgi:hypothetical protein
MTFKRNLVKSLRITSQQNENGKMEEDVKPEDEDGVDGWGVGGWDGRVCGLGTVDASLAFGLICGAGDFATLIPSFVLVSEMPFV